MSTYQLAVMGNPIWQSQSPIIHNMFAEEFNLSISYERVLVQMAVLSKLFRRLLRIKVMGSTLLYPAKIKHGN